MDPGHQCETGILAAHSATKFPSFPHRYCEARSKVETGTDTIDSLKKFKKLKPIAKFQHMSQNATPATDCAFRHHFSHPCQCAFGQIRNTTCLKSVPAKNNEAGHVQTGALATKKCNTFFGKRGPAAQAISEMSPSMSIYQKHAARAMRKEATWHVKRRKVTTPGRLPLGRARRPSQGRLRTVGQHPANTSLARHPQGETESFDTQSGKNDLQVICTVPTFYCAIMIHWSIPEQLLC